MNTEYEQGTYVGTPRHRHNGYYAGDFSGRPLPTGLRRDLMAVRRPAWVGTAATTRLRGQSTGPGSGWPA